MSNYDTWLSTDTLGDEQAAHERRDAEFAEDTRAERWRTFVDWAKGDRVRSDSEWAAIVLAVYHNMRGQSYWTHDDINDVISDFAESEGWDGVLSALSRAMREQRAA